MFLSAKWYSDFSLKVPSQDWLGKFCIFDSYVALTVCGEYQNKKSHLNVSEDSDIAAGEGVDNGVARFTF